MSTRTNTPHPVAAIGPGFMGYGITSSALRGGNKVWAVDVDTDQVLRFIGDGGQNSKLYFGTEVT